MVLQILAQDPDVVEDVLGIRGNGQYLLIAAEGLVELSHFFPGQGQVEEDVAILGAEPGRLLIGLSRLGIVALFKKDDPQIIMGRGRLRGQGYDAAEPVGGLVRFPVFEKEQGQEVAELRIVLIGGQQGLIAGQGLIEISGLVIFSGLVKEVHGVFPDCRN